MKARQIFGTLLGAIAITFSFYANAFSGTYAGLDAVGAWGNSAYTLNSNCPDNPQGAVFCNASPDPSAINGSAVGDSGSGRFNLSAFNIGAHIGRNWSKDIIVYGLEADLNGLDMSQTVTTSGQFPFTFMANSYIVSESVSTKWLATIRGRLGFVVEPSVLLFATAGAAFTTLRTASTYSDNAIDATFPGGSGSNQQSYFKTGWTIGGGSEYKLNKAYSIKAEYLYVAFGDTNLTLQTTNTPQYYQDPQLTADLKVNLVRVGFSYRFC